MTPNRRPTGGSVNDRIATNLCSVCYASVVDNAVNIIQQLGMDNRISEARYTCTCAPLVVDDTVNIIQQS